MEAALTSLGEPCPRPHTNGTPSYSGCSCSGTPGKVLEEILLSDQRGCCCLTNELPKQAAVFSLQCKDSRRSFHLQRALEQSPNPDKSGPFSCRCPRSQGRAPGTPTGCKERKRPSEGGDTGIHLARGSPNDVPEPTPCVGGGITLEGVTVCPNVAKPGPVIPK